VETGLKNVVKDILDKLEPKKEKDGFTAQKNAEILEQLRVQFEESQRRYSIIEQKSREDAMKIVLK